MKTLKEVLLYETDSDTLAVIEDGGWVKGVVYIDSEDLATTSLPQNLLSREVKEVTNDDSYYLGGSVISCYVINLK